MPRGGLPWGPRTSFTPPRFSAGLPSSPGHVCLSEQPADCSAELRHQSYKEFQNSTSRGKVCHVKRGRDQANGSPRKEQTQERILDCGALGRHRRDGSGGVRGSLLGFTGRICSGLGFRRTRAARSGERSPRTAGPLAALPLGLQGRLGAFPHGQD